MSNRSVQMLAVTLALPAALRAQHDLPPVVQAERLVKLLELPDHRPAAMHALWQLGCDAAPALSRAIKDPRFEVVQSACAVIHDIGPAAASLRTHLEKRLQTADAQLARVLRWALHGVSSTTVTIATWGGKVVVLDQHGAKVREHGSFDNLWDVQTLPDDRLLIAQTAAGVAEVDADGKELWRYKGQLQQTLGAQRLFDGHTLIADATRGIVEVDGDGKIVWHHKSSARWAQRLLNGHTLFMDAGTNKLIEIDAKGTQLVAHDIPNNVFGASRLPNGHTLVPTRAGNRLLELDAKGTVVKETKTVIGPNDCLRLLDGRTIIAGANEVVAYDAKGKQLWRYEAQWVGGLSR